MKRCPKCRRRFSDYSLNFCLDDGSPLLQEPDSEPTLVSPTIAASVSPSQQDFAPHHGRSTSSRFLLVGLLILLAMLLGGAAVVLLYKINNWNSATISNSKESAPTPAAAVRKASPAPTLEATPVR